MCKCCQTKFDKDLEGIEAFKAWLTAGKCKTLIMKSTGIYWIPLYAAL
ncbi:MAG: hypothetical protein QXR42_05765 [Candidatus Bathyarchaeia archaeon]